MNANPTFRRALLGGEEVDGLSFNKERFKLRLWQNRLGRGGIDRLKFYTQGEGCLVSRHSFAAVCYLGLPLLELLIRAD